MMPDYTHTLVATLGGQPQIVTFTLDLLLQENIPISHVVVIHPQALRPRLQHALARLNAEFVGDYYQKAHRTIHFRSQVLQLNGKPIDDIVDDAHADGTLDTIHQLIVDLKRQSHRIHLSVTGGRRLMSLLAISVAPLNFDRHDHIWHIHTPEHIKEQANEGRLMHVPEDAGVKLIQGPFISLGEYIYNQPQSFRSAQQEQRLQLEAQERARCASVEKDATSSQRKVLQAFGKGLKPQQVADELHLALPTVHSHKTALLGLCRNVWNIPLEEHLDYHFLQLKFATYFDGDE